MLGLMFQLIKRCLITFALTVFRRYLYAMSVAVSRQYSLRTLSSSLQFALYLCPCEDIFRRNLFL